MPTVICSDKSIKVKHLDKDGGVDSRRDGFIFTGTIQLTKTDVSKSFFSPNWSLNMTAITLHSVLSSPSIPLYFTFSIPSLPPASFPLSLSLSLSVELIGYVSSIHLSLCRLATGALSGVEGGSFTRGGVGGWEEVG